MKLIRTEDAAGQVLSHDITQIIPGEFKGARFRKGHIVQPEDIPVLLSIGKENLYVWEKKPGILHEDEAAALLYKAAAGKNIHGTAPKEGKIELIADCDGLCWALSSSPLRPSAPLHKHRKKKESTKHHRTFKRKESTYGSIDCLLYGFPLSGGHQPDREAASPLPCGGHQEH